MKKLSAVVVAAAALAAAAPALADAPTTTTSELHLSFVDDSTCSFAFTVTLDVIRTVTTFANGDVKRKIELEAVDVGNGHAAVESDTWNVFIDHADPTNWKLTGRFGQIFLDGKLVYLQSGLIAYDVANGVVSDPHPGPMGVQPDACTLLGS